MVDRQLGVFFKHLGYFEYRYGPVVSSECSVLLGGYLEGRLGLLPLDNIFVISRINQINFEKKKDIINNYLK